MKHQSNQLLLLGAGFSRNWGGWLSDDVFEYIISSDEVEADLDLRAVVWRHQDAGFESALEEVQQDATTDPTSNSKRDRLNALQAVILRMFGEMNGVFFNQVEFEFQKDRARAVRTFLTKFDAIFTLNQDLLLEHHYVDTFDVSLELPRRWDSVELPGMRRDPIDDPMFHRSWARALWRPHSDSEFELRPNAQPYIKLHGSSNWASADGQRLLVMGGGKEKQIQSHPVLNRYALEFETRLCQPDTRLVVIGYGFRDHHINRAIEKAVYGNGLKMFIIAPKWKDLSKVFCSSGGHPGAAMVAFGYDLQNVFRHGVKGGSSRFLNEIFGGDELERGKVVRFLQR